MAQHQPPLGVTERPPYDRTAVRPAWTDLPPHVQHAVASLAGGDIVDVRVATGGFTRGFAALCRLDTGDEVFVKAADGAALPEIASSYRQEVAVLARLPAGVPAPRLRWSGEIGEWVLLGIEPVTGRMPGLPWTDEDLARSVDVCERTARALTPAPGGLSLGRLADDVGPEAPFVGWFAQVARGQVRGLLLSPWARTHLDELDGLAALAGDAVDGPTACHGDLRPDNLLVTDAGNVLICDWNWLSLGAAWTDLVGLLVTAYADGHDASAVFRSSVLSEDVADEAVDAWLAAIAAYMLHDPHDSPSFASPWLPTHAAYYGTAALSWLERRRG